ncbi:MAG: Nif3-like dinuclear metal center hexameric protein [Pseudomonadota bacterium]
MVALKKLIAYTDDLLDVHSFKDYCPNGLQVEGSAELGRLISGVTASRALIETAIERRADALLVHHGYFWKGEDPCITGLMGARLRLLLQHDISLIVYHLPLDAHVQFGNNVRLAARLGLQVDGPLGDHRDGSLGLRGSLATSLDADSFARLVEQKLGRAPLLIAGGSHRIRSMGWCTGAAQGFIERAAALGLDAYLSGEISEPTVHIAREAGIHYLAAGHHATERYGVQALGDHLAQVYGVWHEFVDIDNPA